MVENLSLRDGGTIYYDAAFFDKEAADALFARLPEPKRLVYVEASDHFFAGALDGLEEEVYQLNRSPN